MCTDDSHIPEGSNLLSHLKKTLAGICKNQLIIAIVAGIIFARFNVLLPVIVSDIITDLSGVATTLALISLGATFSFVDVLRNVKHIFWIGLGKLVVYPAAAILLAVWQGFTGPELVAVIAVFATPCGISGYSMAAATDNDDELAGQLVVVTSLAAVFTLTMVLSLCQIGGWI